ncbi:MAG: hypothetical protein J5755_02135 [Clostridia bacterium]|nr:hypothetical protein [Clostridia bacterium]
MKKIISVLVIVLLVSALAAFTLSGCKLFDNMEISGDGHLEITADTKEDCETLLNNFLEDSLKDINVVVTAKLNGENYYVETISGDTGLLAFSDGFTVFTFVQGDKYCLRCQEQVDGEVVDEQSKELYDSYHCNFLLDVKAPFSNEGTFAAQMITDDHDETKGGNTVTTSQSTFTLTVTMEEGTITVNGTAVNGLVQSVTLDSQMLGGVTNLALTFAYGNANPVDPFAGENE